MSVKKTIEIVALSKIKRTCSSLSELETVTTVDGGRAAMKAASDVEARSSFGVVIPKLREKNKTRLDCESSLTFFFVALTRRERERALRRKTSSSLSRFYTSLFHSALPRAHL